MIASVIFIILIGLVIQYSIGLNSDNPSASAFYKQLAFVGVGAVLFFLFTFLDYRMLKMNALVYAGVGILILIAVLLFGTTIKGTTGWFVLGGFSLQPVEFVKLVFILFMAAYMKSDIHAIQQPKYFFISGAIAAAFVGAIMLQPDTGSALIIFMLWFCSILILRAPWWLTALVVATVVLASVLGWFFFFPDYQKERLSTFMNPEADPLGSGYNVTQSIVAVGSGSMWGRGLGLGTQSQLHFLPEATSDFIFAVVAEEFGFVGVVALLLAIGTILFRLWRAAYRSQDPFAFVFIIGVWVYLFIQSTLVIGMNIGVLPVTGVPLPLISAGGSSMLATLTMLGLAHRMSIEA